MNRAALVTGGSSGIGLATGQMLARNGFALTVLGRTAGKLRQAVKELEESGTDVVGEVVDVADAGSIAMADACEHDAPAALDPARDALAELETLIGAHGYVLDGGFSLADCAVAPALWRSRRLPLDFGAWPKVARVRETLTSRPAFEAAGPVA